MQDQPSAIELLEALGAFLREEVAPRLDGGLRFKALVGANVAGIVAREIALGPAQDRDQTERLWKLLGREGNPPAGSDFAALARELSRELTRRICEGDGDSGSWRTQVLIHLRASVREKLAVDNPKLLDVAR